MQGIGCFAGPVKLSVCGRAWAWLAWPALLLLAACATPGERIAQLAGEAGLLQQVIDGEGFRHVVLYRRDEASGRRLHVYIDHDGRPWIGGTRVASDPSPREPLALALMLQDPGDAIYLGRPCHYVAEGQAGCHPLVWTHERYGEAVVASMAAAIKRWMARTGHAELVLIGYSGGGTLATLLAARLPQTAGLISVAANLDVDAWVRLHQYSPLVGSLDPAAQDGLNPHVLQHHHVGGRDRNVPPELSNRFIARQAAARVVVHTEFDHTCCWVEAWPGVLELFNSSAP